MPSFFDLQKFAATGIASADMTAFDKMRALAAFGGGAVQTLTDVPPLSFRANGKPLISWSMLGNGSQSGTPTPDAQIMPTFCGVRTANLLDIDIVEEGYNISAYGEIIADSRRIATTTHIDVTEMSSVTVSYSSIGGVVLFIYALFNDSTLVTREVGKVTGANIDTSNGNKLYICWYRGSETITKANISNIMLNSGSTAPPYEPYGYKIPITCAGQTTPVYLGQVQTVRKIKKLVLTGEEDWYSNHLSDNLFNLGIDDYVKNTNATICLCTHYKAQQNITLWTRVQDKSVCFFDTTSSLFYLRDSNFLTVADLKAYLAAQYANGTPVTVWYVLNTPETAIVNEPLAKIGDYADELHSEDAGVTIPTARGQNTLTVDTELQPSSMTITYKG